MASPLFSPTYMGLAGPEAAEQVLRVGSQPGWASMVTTDALADTSTTPQQQKNRTKSKSLTGKGFQPLAGVMATAKDPAGRVWLPSWSGAGLSPLPDLSKQTQECQQQRVKHSQPLPGTSQAPVIQQQQTLLLKLPHLWTCSEYVP